MKSKVSGGQLTLILGNSNKKFSGVTSTMLQVLAELKGKADVSVLGAHFLPDDVQAVGFFECARRFRRRANLESWPIFHARRNNEMLQALILKRLFRCQFKIVFTSTAQRTKTWITRWLMSQMDGLISTCQAAADYMESPPDVIIPHGIDASLYRPVEIKNDVGVAIPFKYAIGIFGRVRSQKGVDTLIAAAIDILPLFPDWGVLVVGEITSDNESFVSDLREKLSTAGLMEKVHFTDKVEFKQVPAYFRAVSIVTALSVNEGFGLTVLEGLASQKPVVATKAGAWPDIAKQSGGSVQLIDVGDVAALSEILSRLMSDPEERRLLGENGRTSVLKHYTIEREAAQLLTYYQNISNNPK